MFGIVSGRLAELKSRYAEAHRAYHNQSHVDAMLRGLAVEASRITAPGIVELAVWYHDAIYDPAASDNEDRSANLLASDMTGVIDAAALLAAEIMIRATVDHVLPPDLTEPLRSDVAAFLDLDTAILGAGRDEYDAYEAGIRAEYEPVHGAAAFRLGRSAFLQGMLGRERLFNTDRFHKALDTVSRLNMRRALDSLLAEGEPVGVDPAH